MYLLMENNNVISAIAASDDECRLSAVVIKIFHLYSPYLMPFTVEFNISIGN